MTFALGRRLLHAGVVQPHELRRAVFLAASSDVPFARALADVSPAAARVLAEPLDDEGAPKQRTIQPVRELVERLPDGMPARLLALPIRVDARTSTIDVAVVDPRDAHVIAELGFHLGAPLRLVVTSLVEMERAIASLVASAPPRARASMTPPPPRASVAPPPPPPAFVAPPAGADDEAPLPLVRRTRAGSVLPPPVAAAPVSIVPTSEGPNTAPMIPPSKPVRNAQPAEARRDTADYERPKATASTAPGVAPALVLDFSSAARESRDAAAPSTHRGAPPAPSRTAIAPKLPPYASLTHVLEEIDEAASRDELVAALLDGLRTFARGAALFAARKGRFVGVAGEGPEHGRLRAANLGHEGAIAEAIELGERVGVLRSAGDAPLLTAIELAGAPSIEVVLRPAYVAGRPAMLLTAWGIGDLQEGARRTRVLATAAGAALERMLKAIR